MLHFLARRTCFTWREERLVYFGVRCIRLMVRPVAAAAAVAAAAVVVLDVCFM